MSTRQDSASNNSTSTTAPSASIESSSPPTVSIPLDSDPLTDHDDLEGAKTVAVPRCSTWFAMDKINPIEKRMLPEFFTDNGYKTAELYLKYRNYMVHAYRQQPGVYLTATACRRNLAGDACAILRVHEFLTHWGLINFHVPPHAMPPAIHSNYALKTADTTAHKQVQGPVAMLVEAKKENARRSRMPMPCEACGQARGADDPFFELTAEAKKKLTSPDATTTTNNNTTNSNAGSNATPLTMGTNGKAGERKEVIVAGFALRPGSGICEQCYIRGAFPEGYDASDFVLMPTVASNKMAATTWTQEETNLLLEAVSSTQSNTMQTSPDNDEEESCCDWNYVASKVGSKTADECLLHFLEMPMWNQLISPGESSRNETLESLDSFTAGAALNAPVLDLVSLVEQVDPMVAKAAAHAALNAIKRLHTMPVTTTKVADGAGVKVEHTQPSGKGNGGAGTSFDRVVAAVSSSAEVAGIGSTAIADGDVAMEDISLAKIEAQDNNDQVKAEAVTKEMLAVTEEAAKATTVALVATRAQTMSDEIAHGPVRELVNELLENQLRQMELKMQQLAVLEQAIVAEKEQLTKEKYQLYVDRLAFAREKLSGR